jgi:uncharacterized protein YcbK (DUF882 family)
MITRRIFLQTLALVTLSGYTMNAFALDKKERLDLTIAIQAKDSILNITLPVYDQEAISRINNLLRCHYSNEIKPMDVRVLTFCDIKDVAGRDKEVLIISGYRRLHIMNISGEPGGEVKDSLHLQACNRFRIPNVYNNACHTGKVLYTGESETF